MGTLPTDPAALAELVSMIRHRQTSLYLPFLVGLWLDAVLMGLIVVQFCRWVVYVRPSDSKWTQGLIWWLMIPTGVTTAFLAAHNSFLFTSGFGDYLRVLNVTFPRATTVNFVASRIPAAAYFAIRAWRLNDKPIWLPAIIIPCLYATLQIRPLAFPVFFAALHLAPILEERAKQNSMVSFAGGIAHTVLADGIPLSKISLNLIVIYSVFEVVSDIVITGSLFYGLLRRKTGWMHTDRLIKRLTRLVMETQTPPALSALIFLTMSLVVGDGTLLGYFIGYGKVHVLCLMYVVNSRIGLSDSAGGASTFSKQSSGQVRSGVRVQTETITQRHSIAQDRQPISPNDFEQDGTSTTDLVRRQVPS